MTFLWLCCILTAVSALKIPCKYVSKKYCCTPRLKTECPYDCAGISCRKGGRYAKTPEEVAKLRERAALKAPVKINSKHTTTRKPQFPKSECNKPPDWKPCIDIKKADDQLQKCCKKSGITGCAAICRYGVSVEEAREYIQSGKCGASDLRPFLKCASQGEDNRPCCKAKGVTQSQCQPFCYENAGRIGPLGVHHLVCAHALRNILSCHWAGLPT